MSEFKKYRRKNIAEMRVAEPEDFPKLYSGISVSSEDLDEVRSLVVGNKVAGMIARNPKNHKDQWYVSKQYFMDNFEEIEE